MKQFKKIINCHICCDVLKDYTMPHTLKDLKNRGGLTKPSTDVMHICNIAEKTFTSRIHDVPKHIEDPVNFLIVKSIAHISIKNLFNCLNDHILILSPINNHLLQIVKLI